MNKLIEEIADKYSHYGKLRNGDDCFVLEYTDACKAMQEFYEAKLKEELIKFGLKQGNYSSGASLSFIEDEINEYLKQRSNG